MTRCRDPTSHQVLPSLPSDAQQYAMSRESRPNILLLTDGVMPYSIGGIQRHSRKLCEQLLRLGSQVTLFHTAARGSLAERAERLEGWDPSLRAGLRAEFVEWPASTWYPGHYLRECHLYSRMLLSRFMQIRMERRIDFIYAQGLTGLAFVAARKDGLEIPPVGVNAHGYEVFQRCSGLSARISQVLLRPAHRRISLDADIVFCFSGKIRQIVEDKIGVHHSRIRELPNAVDPTWVTEDVARPGRQRKFVFVGRYERRKGVQELTRALRILEGIDWTMDFVGPIPESSRIRDPRIHYRGVIRDEQELMGIYDTCDCIVAPSYAEGMPTVLIEAMARGLTPLATDVGAVRELVTAAGGSLLSDPSPAEIRAGIAQIATLADGELYRRKCAARDAARSFTWDLVGDATMQAIENHLS